jgi:LPS-assembly protein
VGNELTRFDIRKNPGTGITTKYPIGDRLNVQPGISHAFTWPFLVVTPRVQLAMTKYMLGNVANTEPKSPTRVIPIGDVLASLYFDRNVNFLSKGYKQTLEPQVYYTYIPYKNQSDFPVFDTTVSTLTYDQLFMYNRFSGIDRINDANQVALGLI